MEPITTFFVALSMLLALAVATLVSVQRPLNEVLVEICGAPHRARFWTRLFSAMLLLSMLFFCLWSPPNATAREFSLHEIVGMLRAGLFGLLSAMSLLALVVLVWQGRFERRAPPPPAEPKQAPFVRADVKSS